MSPFFCSLPHTLTVFLSISSDCNSWSSHFLYVLLSLELTPKNGRMALLLQLFPQGQMTLAFCFFLFSLACLTHLLNFALNRKLTLEAWGSKLINELWQGMWARPTQCFAPNNLPLQPTTEEIFNPSLQSEFMLANSAQSFSFTPETTLVNMLAGFSFV